MAGFQVIIYGRFSVIAEVNGILAFFSIITALAVVYQGSVMREQLSEIKSTAWMNYHQALNAGAQARAANSFAESATSINTGIEKAVKKLNLQANQLAENGRQAARLAADTEKANETSIAALHISQRAYIYAGPFTVDPDRHTVLIPLINGGHIPSGEITIEEHEAVFQNILPDFQMDPQYAIEASWKREELPSISPGPGPSVYVKVATVSRDKLFAATQGIIVAGKITYRDGFPDDSTQDWYFCYHTNYSHFAKELLFTACKDRGATMKELEHLDGYPNNEQR